MLCFTSSGSVHVEKVREDAQEAGKKCLLELVPTNNMEVKHKQTNEQNPIHCRKIPGLWKRNKWARSPLELLFSDTGIIYNSVLHSH